MSLTLLTIEETDNAIGYRYFHSVKTTDYGLVQYSYLKPADDLIPIWNKMIEYKAYKLSDKFYLYRYNKNEHFIGMAYTHPDQLLDEDFIFDQAEFLVNDISEEFLFYLSLKYSIKSRSMNIKELLGNKGENVNG